MGALSSTTSTIFRAPSYTLRLTFQERFFVVQIAWRNARETQWNAHRTHEGPPSLVRRPKQWLPKQPGGNRRDTTNIRWRAILLRKFYYSFCDVGLLALQFKKYVIPAWKQTNISTFSAFSICTATSTTQGSHILQQKSCYCGKKNQ